MPSRRSSARRRAATPPAPCPQHRQRVPAPGDDDQIGVGQGRRRVRRDDGQPAVAPDRIGRAGYEVDLSLWPAADDLVRADWVERREVRIDDERDLHHSITSKLNIMPLSWCSAMWQ